MKWFVGVNVRLCWLAMAVYRKVFVLMYRPLFAAYGRNFHFDPFGFYSFENISVGDDVNLGSMPILMAAKSRILIGSKIMFGPQVVLIGGGGTTHRWLGSSWLMYITNDRRMT